MRSAISCISIPLVLINFVNLLSSLFRLLSALYPIFTTPLIHLVRALFHRLGAAIWWQASSRMVILLCEILIYFYTLHSVIKQPIIPK